MKRQTGSDDNPRSVGLRAQSETLGFVLMIGLVIAGAITIVSMGIAAVGESEDSLATDRAEKTLTQMDSKLGLVALEGADRQTVSLPGTGSDSYSVDDGSGWMNITFQEAGEDGETHTIENVTLGEITYAGSDGTKVAYQGGGVWRSEPNGQAMMVSPPEFHYRHATLTLPIISVSGDEHLSNSATISYEQSTKKFPNPEENANFTNPLIDGQVNVTVQSEYYRGWGSYFEERTDGGVSYDHANNQVTAELVVPIEDSFDSVAATTQGDGITVNGNDPKPSPNREGVNYPSADPNVEEEIEDCENNGCTDLTDGITIEDGGTYYSNSDFDGSVAIDDPSDDVSIVVNGDFTPSDMEIRNLGDDADVNTYVRKDFTVPDKVNHVEGDPGDLSVMVHSDGDVDFLGNSYFHGLVYAPESECTQNGDGYIEGGLICDELTINGNPSDFDYDDSITESDLNLEGDVSRITYLHVSTNSVEVDSN